MAEADRTSIWTIGRRKAATARVRLCPGTGKITINGRAFENYFPTESLRLNAMEPLSAVEAASRYDVQVNLAGGGPMGQAGAMRHGLARALVQADTNWRPALKSGGFLTRDARIKERKKYGQPGARKRFQFSKR